MQDNRPPFSVIPSRAVTDSSISDASLRTLLAIASHCDQNGVCFPSVDRLAKMLNKTNRSVRRHMSELCNGGYLQKIHQFNKGYQTVNKYRILFDSPEFSIEKLSTGGDATCQGRGDTTCQGRGDTTCQAEHYQLTINKKKEDFIKSVKEEMGDDDYTLEQSEACFDYWLAQDAIPKGDLLASFRGWLRNAKRLGVKKGSPKKKNEVFSEPEHLAQWRLRVKGFKKNGFWHANWGRKPDDKKGCEAPEWLINEVYGQKRLEV